MLDYKRGVSEINFTCSYDRYSPIYAGGGCWERMDLGLYAPRNHHQRISIIVAGKNDLGNAPIIIKQTKDRVVYLF